MVTKVLFTLILVSTVVCRDAGSIRTRRGAAVVAAAIPVPEEPFDLNPQYAYSYSIQDALTGDAKAHTESRNGENIQGSYSVVDPDGTLRVVSYTAGREGFNAVVDRRPYAAPAPSVVSAPQYIPAASVPVQTVVATPVIRKRRLHRKLPGFVPAFQNQIVAQLPPVQFVQQPAPPSPPQVVQPEPQPVQVEPQPFPVQEQPQQVATFPQPQPQPSPPQQEFPAFPQPPPQQQFPQPQPPPQQQFPQPQPPAFPQPSPPQQAQQDDFDTVEVEAAPRSSANNGNFQPRSAGPASVPGPSSFTFSSRRGDQYDFRVAY